MCRLATLVLGLAMCVMLSSEAARGQDIDSLFRQFNHSHDAGDYQRSEQIARQMLRASTTPGWRAASLNSLGRACHNLQKNSEAIGYFKQAMQISLATDNVNRGWIPSNLALVYMDQKQYAEAESLLQQALRVFQSQKGSSSSEAATVLNNLGRLYHDKQDYEQSRQYHQRALAIRESIYGAQHKQVSYSLANLGDVYRHLEQYDQAEPMLKRAIAMKEKVFGPRHKEVAATLSVLATLHRDRGELARAEEIDRRVLEMREQLLGANHPQVATTLENLANDVEQDRPEEAATLRERAARIAASQPTKYGIKPAKPMTLEIASETADVYAGPTVIARAVRGQSFDVTHIKGDWYAIVATVQGEKKTGWLRRQDVKVTSDDATPAALVPGLVWQSFAPPRGKFRVQVPGSPLAKQQTVNGVVNHAFDVDTADAKFLVSWFDVPSGSTLSFDSAINAYMTARQATLQSQRSFDIDLYPGREFTVRMPSGSMSKMRLLAVNKRWYQLVVEGAAGAIHGDDANRFFNSFQLTD